MMRDYSLDDLRNFARDVDRLPYTTNSLGLDQNANPTNSKPEKIFKGEDIDNTTGLKSRYSFLTWERGYNSNGPSLVEENAGAVVVLWGGALAGHWGFGVAVNGGKLDFNGGLADWTEPGNQVLRVSDDIVFFTDYR
jgi:hypothetical protein